MDEQHGIGWAVKQLHNGSSVARTGWNGKNQCLKLQVPDQHSKMTQPYVYIEISGTVRVPWLCSQSDLLSTDWFVL